MGESKKRWKFFRTRSGFGFKNLWTNRIPERIQSLSLRRRSLSCKRSRMSHSLFLIHLVKIRHFVTALLQAGHCSGYDTALLQVGQCSGYDTQLSTLRTQVRFAIGLCMCDTACRNLGRRCTYLSFFASKPCITVRVGATIQVCGDSNYMAAAFLLTKATYCYDWVRLPA